MAEKVRADGKLAPIYAITPEVKQFIEHCLDTDAAEGVKKQRHTARRIYNRLVEEFGYTGSESAIRAAVHEAKAITSGLIDASLDNTGSGFNSCRSATMAILMSAGSATLYSVVIMLPIPLPAQPRPRVHSPISESTLCWHSRRIPPVDRHTHRGDNEVVAPALAQRDRDCKS